MVTTSALGHFCSLCKASAAAQAMVLECRILSYHVVPGVALHCIALLGGRGFAGYASRQAWIIA